jgi:hypothetical protein
MSRSAVRVFEHLVESEQLRVGRSVRQDGFAGRLLSLGGCYPSGDDVGRDTASRQSRCFESVRSHSVSVARARLTAGSSWWPWGISVNDVGGRRLVRSGANSPQSHASTWGSTPATP